MQVINIGTLSHTQQAIWDSIPGDLRDVLCTLTWDEHLQLIGQEKDVLYMYESFNVHFLSNNPKPLLLDQMEGAKVYTYNNVILEVEFPSGLRLQLGFPYKETTNITEHFWDSHDHSHYTQQKPAKSYRFICYCSKHPRIQEYLKNEK
jgi:hypothetical protein